MSCEGCTGGWIIGEHGAVPCPVCRPPGSPVTYVEPESLRRLREDGRYAEWAAEKQRLARERQPGRGRA